MLTTPDLEENDSSSWITSRKGLADPCRKCEALPALCGGGQGDPKPGDMEETLSRLPHTHAYKPAGQHNPMPPEWNNLRITREALC